MRAVSVSLRHLADRAAPLLAALVLLAVWEGACRLFAVPAYLLPAPSAILASALKVPATVWLGHVVATLEVSLLGLAVAIAVAIPLGMILAGSPQLMRVLYPLLIVVQSTPVVAVAPIIVVVLGAGAAPRVVITFLITFFPIVVSTVTGLQATPEEVIELSRSLNASRAREMRNIRLPYAIPYIFSGLRVSVTLSIVGAVVAEFVAADRGLGFFIGFSTSFLKVPQAFAALAILVVLSLGLFRLVVLIQTWFFAWSLPKGER